MWPVLSTYYVLSTGLYHSSSHKTTLLEPWRYLSGLGSSRECSTFHLCLSFLCVR